MLSVAGLAIWQDLFEVIENLDFVSQLDFCFCGQQSKYLFFWFYFNLGKFVSIDFYVLEN